MSEGFNNFRFGIGVIAETLRIFRAELLKNGFNTDEAMRLTEVFLRETLASSYKNNKEDI